MARSRSRSRDRHRSSHSHRQEHSDRRRDDRCRDSHRQSTRDRDRERYKSERHSRHDDDHTSDHRRRYSAEERYREDVGDREDGSRKRAAEAPAQSEEEVKRQRLAKLAAWRQQQNGPQVKAEEPSNPPVFDAFADDDDEEDEKPIKHEAQSTAWMPWEDPATAFRSASHVIPPEIAAKKAAAALAEAQAVADQAQEDDDVDPLDAFMDAAVNPEVAAAEKAEAARKEELRKQQAKALADGKQPAIPKLDELLAPDSDSEEEPDLELQLPANKVKYMVGQGGDKIKYIQRKTKCRIQVKKEQAELARAFGSGPQLLPGKGMPLPDGQKRMVTVMLFGSASECENARRLIEEACDNKEQKAKQRAKEYEKKKDEKRRDRQLYHMRHTHDYEALEVPLGASKADIKKAFRLLAKKWHPDKHPDNQEEAKTRFQAIQKAFESLMSTDEDARIEALTAAANEAHMP